MHAARRYSRAVVDMRLTPLTEGIAARPAHVWSSLSDTRRRFRPASTSRRLYAVSMRCCHILFFPPLLLPLPLHLIYGTTNCARFQGSSFLFPLVSAVSMQLLDLSRLEVRHHSHTLPCCWNDTLEQIVEFRPIDSPCSLAISDIYI